MPKDHAVRSALCCRFDDRGLNNPARRLDHHEHPAWFILPWLACAWLTTLALLLALFDLLIVCAQARAAREQLRDQFAAKSTPGSQTNISGR